MSRGQAWGLYAALWPPPQADPVPGHGLELDVGLRGGEHEVMGHVPHTLGGEGNGAAQGVNIFIPGQGETRNNCIRNTTCFASVVICLSLSCQSWGVEASDWPEYWLLIGQDRSCDPHLYGHHTLWELD